jgi:hypothetical protein
MNQMKENGAIGLLGSIMKMTQINYLTLDLR